MPNAHMTFMTFRMYAIALYNSIFTIKINDNNKIAARMDVFEEILNVKL